jgi:hypothetical protein
MHIKWQFYRWIFPVILLFQMGCAGNEQQTHTNKQTSQSCSYSFEAKASDSVLVGGKVQRIYSVYVDNALNLEEIKQCAATFEKDAQTRTAKAGLARVYYFNCPHHTPSFTSGDSINLSAKNFYVAAEMYPYCVGMVEVGEDIPKPVFKPSPFTM